MTIYKFATNVVTNGGTGSINTLKIPGGLCRLVYILASTSTTTFRANMTDEDSDVIRAWDYHREEINELNILPVVGQYTFNITNASADGSFRIAMLVQE